MEQAVFSPLPVGLADLGESEKQPASQAPRGVVSESEGETMTPMKCDGCGQPCHVLMECSFLCRAWLCGKCYSDHGEKACAEVLRESMGNGS